MLEVRDLRAGYGALEVLRDINLDIPEGKLVALLGGNGAGKTTTMNAIAGIIPARGKITFRHEELLGRLSHAIFGKGIALVPQGRYLFPEMTVFDNLELGVVSRSVGGREMRERIEQAFRWFPRLEERRMQRAGSLSGGEQQMLATARALVSKPSLLLLDEPTTGLAPMIVAELSDICRRLKDDGLTILLVEQNVEMALDIADYVYLIQEGRIVKGATIDAVKDQKDSIFASYLGM